MDFLVAVLEANRGAARWVALGVVVSVLGCSGTEVSRVRALDGDGAASLRDGSHAHSDDAARNSGGWPDVGRPKADAGPWSDGGVFGVVDSGPPKPPRTLCAGSEGGAATEPDARASSCTWEHCPGAVALSPGPDNCVIMRDNTVRCSSGAGPDLVDQGLSDVQSMASGAIHHCALRSDGTVWCWGKNEWGALGDPSLPTQAVLAQPTKVPGVENVIRLDTRDGFRDEDITCALDRNSEVICWGGEWPRAPTRVAELAGSREIGVADASVCGLGGAGTIRCVWTGGGVSTYLLNDRVVGLSAASYMLCARTESSDVFCMGAGGKPAPYLLPELSGARFFATGLAQVCGLLADGTLACSPGSEGRVFPEGCEGTDVVDLQASTFSLCALHADGDISCRNAF
jgi:hypothetical protein